MKKIALKMIGLVLIILLGFTALTYNFTASAQAASTGDKVTARTQGTLIDRRDLGNLLEGNVESFIDIVARYPRLKGFLGIGSNLRFDQAADEYAFQILSTSDIDILLSHKSRKDNGDADLRLFRDDDRDGKLDVPQEPVIDASLKGGGANESIKRQIPAGNYIVGVVIAKNGSADYSLRIANDRSDPIRFVPQPTIPRIPSR
jgi:hypothetical protein